jgi:2-oxo-3-hexenedioate decarboxylase
MSSPPPSATAGFDPDRWATYLMDAVDRRSEVPAIVGQLDALSIDQAYEIQDTILARRIAAGETVVGAKLGLTSKAKQEQMGVNEPAFGFLTDRTVLASDEVVIADLVHPRVEPEFVFLIGEDLEGPSVSADDVLDATTEVRGGIEVIDSRYEAFKFSLVDVIADNTSEARCRIGSTGISPRSTDIAAITCDFEIDGEMKASATGAALLGDPAACVAMLVHHLHRFGRKVEAGWTILAGAATDAQPLAIGTTARALYSELGSVQVIGK